MKDKFNIVEALSMVTQIGLNMIISIFLCLAVGSWVDNKFGTNLTIFFVAFGIISGYCGAYSMLKKLIDRMCGKTDEDTELEQAIQEQIDIEQDDMKEDDDVAYDEE